jgi:hypothetical protein
MNMDKWNGLDADTQSLISSQIKSEFEAPAWETAQGALVSDIACLTGNGDCAGETRGMTLVEATDADIARASDILKAEVLPDWAERAGAEWKDRWNASVGKAVGVTIN